MANRTLDKCFTEGQKVFVVGKYYYRDNKPVDSDIEEWTVSKVGRSYLYAKRSANGREYAFFSDEDRNFLIQKSDYSPDFYLFSSKDDIANERISAERIKFIRHYMEYSAKSLDKGQIDAIYDILVGGTEDGAVKEE